MYKTYFMTLIKPKFSNKTIYTKESALFWMTENGVLLKM